MTAKIDIRTPAGKSLEGFPKIIEGFENDLDIHFDNSISIWEDGDWKNTQLHKSDIITIEIL